MIALKGITKTFGPVRSLVNVTAQFRQGQTTVLRGANGSGKSTLLSIIGTLTRPSSGSITYGSLGRSSTAIRNTLGWVGHDSLCYADLTGRENLELTARLYGLTGDGVLRRACDRFILDGFVDRPVRTYSRGQRQRLALARALMHGPKLLVLDEPTTGLDEASVARLATILREEANGGAWVILATHDEGFERQVSDQVIELDRGRLHTE